MIAQRRQTTIYGAIAANVRRNRSIGRHTQTRQFSTPDAVTIDHFLYRDDSRFDSLPGLGHNVFGKFDTGRHWARIKSLLSR